MTESEGDVRVTKTPSKGVAALAIASALGAVIGATMMLWYVAMPFSEAQTSTGRDASTDIETAPGRPLDAVRYEAPTMSYDEWCWRVTDRATGASWWLVQMADSSGNCQWLALPICDGSSPADPLE